MMDQAIHNVVSHSMLTTEMAVAILVIIMVFQNAVHPTSVILTINSSTICFSLCKGTGATLELYLSSHFCMWLH
jgi:hypothetical protein